MGKESDNMTFSVELILSKINQIKGCKVMIDRDLAIQSPIKSSGILPQMTIVFQCRLLM